MLVITYFSNFFLVTYNVRYLKQYVGRNQGSQIGRFHGRLAENFFCWPLSKIIVWFKTNCERKHFFSLWVQKLVASFH